MDNSPVSSFTFFLSVFLFLIKLSSSVRVCKPVSCGDMGPQIRFPFRLIGRQARDCGYPGFDLSCNNQSQTVLTLPASGEFLVNRIDYTAQAIYLSDPDYCLPQRIVNFNLHGSPFAGAVGKNYTFYNCSSDLTGYITNRAVPLPCLDNKNYLFLATTFDLKRQQLPPACEKVKNVSVPLQLSLAQYWSAAVLSADIELVWDEPGCQRCEVKGLYCGLKNESGLEVGCSILHKRGMSKSVKYGIILGLGIPGLVCAIGMACNLCIKIRYFRNHQNISNSRFLANGMLHPAPPSPITGLDLKTIESYPKIIVGESRRLPNKITDGSCSICLSEYLPRETLRSIPECNHFFHAGCIDEWLKLHPTCPVCRNVPESAISMTPFSSESSAAFSSSSSV